MRWAVKPPGCIASAASAKQQGQREGRTRERVSLQMCASVTRRWHSSEQGCGCPRERDVKRIKETKEGETAR